MVSATKCIAGGHGAVAQLAVQGRLQAVKSAHRGDKSSARRLRFEAAHLAAITHASFPKACGLTETPQGPVLHMDWVDGRTVDALIAERPMISTDACLLVAADVCAALADVNAQIDFVHRDVKPANLMVTPEGRVMIVDLGCARSSHGDPDWKGDIVGTLVYMAPERLDGGDHGPAVDVYGIGLVLLELLCGARVGHKPWGTTADAPRIGSVSSERHHTGILYALRSADAARGTSLDRAIWASVFGMLSWDADKRPALRDAAKDLRRLVRDEATARTELADCVQRITKRDEPVPQVGARARRGRRFAAQVGAAAAMAACAGLALLLSAPPLAGVA
jgi:serine/threonine protein kinase